MQTIDEFVLRDKLGNAVSDILQELEVLRIRSADNVAEYNEEGAQRVGEHGPR